MSHELAFFEDMHLFDGAVEIAGTLHPEIIEENIVRVDTEAALEAAARENVVFFQNRAQIIAKRLIAIGETFGMAKVNEELEQIVPEVLPEVLAALKTIRDQKGKA